MRWESDHGWWSS